MGARKRPKPYRNGNYVLGRRGDWWVADIRDESTGKRVSRIRLVKGGPEETARRALDRLADAKRAVAKNQIQYTVGQLWALYLKDRARDKLRNDIYEANWVSLRKNFENRIPALLTKDDWRDYAEHRLIEEGRSSWTVHTELSRLKACLKWAVETHLLDKMPLWWLPQRGKPRDRVLTFDEADRLVRSAAEHSDPHILLFILLALSTGARHMAILDLTWDRVDFENNTIQYDENRPIEPLSKSWRKGRATVPMGSRLKSLLLRAYEARQTNYVIEHGGRRLKTVREGFAAAVRRAGLSADITPHTLRHTVSTWLKEKGVGLEYRSQLLGHADSRTTDIGYSHAQPAYLTETVEILDALLPQIPDSERVVGKRRRANIIDLVPLGQSGDLNRDSSDGA